MYLGTFRGDTVCLPAFGGNCWFILVVDGGREFSFDRGKILDYMENFMGRAGGVSGVGHGRPNGIWPEGQKILDRWVQWKKSIARWGFNRQ